MIVCPKKSSSLNHKIVSRLRFLRDLRSHTAMVNFRIGEKVRFHPAGHPEITGTLTRYNKKSVSIVVENGQRWNVHPGLLSRVAEDRPCRNNARNDAKDHESSLIQFPQLGAKPGS
ncbi:MAG TPA: hypothetical protein VI685_20110 [Candidatus Angelobacter sp.]